MHTNGNNCHGIFPRTNYRNEMPALNQMGLINGCSSAHSNGFEHQLQCRERQSSRIIHSRTTPQFFRELSPKNSLDELQHGCRLLRNNATSMRSINREYNIYDDTPTLADPHLYDEVAEFKPPLMLGGITASQHLIASPRLINRAVEQRLDQPTTSTIFISSDSKETPIIASSRIHTASDMACSKGKIANDESDNSYDEMELTDPIVSTNPFTL